MSAQIDYEKLRKDLKTVYLVYTGQLPVESGKEK